MTTPWTGVFEIRDPDGRIIDGPTIPLVQVSNDRFRVDASFYYLGDTGLDPSLDDQIRTLEFDAERRSDLASVPVVLRWFEDPYGPHTPAALYHDRFLAEPGPLTDVQADTYFRSMLASLGVPVFKRLVMWTGLSLRTRWVSSLRNKVLLTVYVILSLGGTLLLKAALLDALGLGITVPSAFGTPITAAAIAIAGWLASSALWGRQWTAALIAGAASPWLLPVGALAFLGRTAYRTIERVLSSFWR